MEVDWANCVWERWRTKKTVVFTVRSWCLCFALCYDSGILRDRKTIDNELKLSLSDKTWCSVGHHWLVGNPLGGWRKIYFLCIAIQYWQLVGSFSLVVIIHVFILHMNRLCSHTSLMKSCALIPRFDWLSCVVHKKLELSVPLRAYHSTLVNNYWADTE